MSGQHDVSESEGSCYQNSRPEFNPQNLHGEKREHSYRLSPDHKHNCKIILHFQETTVIYTQVQALLYFTPSVEEHKVDITKAWAASALRCSSAQ